MYDCCTTIRKKINAHLANGNTAAGFLREIGGINSNALARWVLFDSVLVRFTFLSSCYRCERDGFDGHR